MDWGAVGIAGGGFVALATGIWATAHWLNRHVVWPLRAVLGVEAEVSITGQAVPSMPMRLASMERTLNDMKRVVMPNGGSSISDQVKSTNGIARSVEESLNDHLVESAKQWKLFHDHIAGH